MKKLLLYLLLCLFIIGITGCNKLINKDEESKEAASKESKSDSDSSISLTSEPLKKSLLKEDEVFLLGKDMFTVQDATYKYKQHFESLILISGKGEILKQFTGVDLLGKTGIINKDSKLYMGTYTSNGYLYGLYDFEALEWAVEPSYKSVDQLTEEYYSAVDQNDSLGVIDASGNIILPLHLPNFEGYISYINGYFAFCNYEKSQILVFDNKGKQTGEIIGYGAEAFGEYIMVYDNDSTPKLYDVYGNLAFDDKSNTDIIYYFDPYAKKIIEHEGTKYRVYDDHYDLLCEGQINSESYIYPQEKYYEISDNTNGVYTQQYYDYEGNLLVTDDENPYNYSSYEYLYYYGNDSKEIDVLDITSMEQFSLKDTLSDSQSLTYLGEQYIGISDYVDNVNKMKIYNKAGEIIYEDDIEWVSLIDNLIVCTKETDFTFESARGIYILINEDGEIIYQSKNKENIVPISDSLLYVQRGNFMGIIDMEGKWLFKTIIGEME